MSATSSTIEPRTEWDKKYVFFVSNPDQLTIDDIIRLSKKYGCDDEDNIHKLQILSSLLALIYTTAHVIHTPAEFLSGFQDDVNKIMRCIWPRARYGLGQLCDLFVCDIEGHVESLVNPTPQTRSKKDGSSAESSDSSDSSAPTVGFPEWCVFLMVVFFLLT